MRALETHFRWHYLWPAVHGPFCQFCWFSSPSSRSPSSMVDLFSVFSLSFLHTLFYYTLYPSSVGLKGVLVSFSLCRVASVPFCFPFYVSRTIDHRKEAQQVIRKGSVVLAQPLHCAQLAVCRREHGKQFQFPLHNTKAEGIENYGNVVTGWCSPEAERNRRKTTQRFAVVTPL